MQTVQSYIIPSLCWIEETHRTSCWMLAEMKCARQWPAGTGTSGPQSRDTVLYDFLDALLKMMHGTVLSGKFAPQYCLIKVAHALLYRYVSLFMCMTLNASLQAHTPDSIMYCNVSQLPR